MVDDKKPGQLEEAPVEKTAEKTASRLDHVEGEEGVEEARMRVKWELLQSLKGRRIVDAQAGFWMSKNTGEEVMLLLDDNTVLYLSTVQLDQDGEPVDEEHEKGVFMGLEALREDRALIWDAENVGVSPEDADAAGCGCGEHDCDCGDDECDCDDDDCDCHGGHADGDDDCGCGHAH